MEIIEATDVQLDFKLSFNNATQISTDSLQPDQLNCKINPNVIRDPTSDQSIGSDTLGSLKIELPRMLDENFAESFISTASRVNNTVTAVALLNMLVMFLLGVSLKWIWTVLNVL